LEQLLKQNYELDLYKMSYKLIDNITIKKLNLIWKVRFLIIKELLIIIKD